jgi:hypothetical protein
VRQQRDTGDGGQGAIQSVSRRVPPRLVWLRAIAVLGLAVLAFAFLVGQPVRHLDGAGPLASRNDPGHESFAALPLDGVASWTYGTRLCLASGAEPAIIDTVTPDAKIGTGFTVLGVRVRQFVPSPTHELVISTDAFPPPAREVPDTLYEAHGYAVSTPCTDEVGAPFTELLVGLGRKGDDGGGWKGIDIAYTVGGRRMVVFLNHDLLVCGTSLGDMCRAPGSPSP